MVEKYNRMTQNMQKPVAYNGVKNSTMTKPSLQYFLLELVSKTSQNGKKCQKCTFYGQINPNLSSTFKDISRIEITLT